MTPTVHSILTQLVAGMEHNSDGLVSAAIVERKTFEDTQDQFISKERKEQEGSAGEKPLISFDGKKYFTRVDRDLDLKPSALFSHVPKVANSAAFYDIATFGADGHYSEAHALLNAVPLGSILIHGDNIESTQTLSQGPFLQMPLGCVIVADQQRNGRGRGSNSWVSPPGCLVFTFTTTAPGPVIPCLQYLACIALVKAATSMPGAKDLPLRIKWPNDIYVEGKKVGGILCQSETSFVNGKVVFIVHIGIGINVDNAEPSTSLNAALRNLRAKQQKEKAEAEAAAAATSISSSSASLSNPFSMSAMATFLGNPSFNTSSSSSSSSPPVSSLSSASSATSSATSVTESSSSSSGSSTSTPSYRFAPPPRGSFPSSTYMGRANEEGGGVTPGASLMQLRNIVANKQALASTSISTSSSSSSSSPSSSSSLSNEPQWFSREELLADTLTLLDQYIAVLTEHGFKPFEPLYLSLWLHQRQRVRVEGKRREYVIVGLTESGFLRAVPVMTAEDVDRVSRAGGAGDATGANAAEDEEDMETEEDELELHPDGNSFDFHQSFVGKKRK